MIRAWRLSLNYKGVIISAYSYYPPQVGKIDIYKYAENISDEYDILVISGSRENEKSGYVNYSDKYRLYRVPVNTEKETIYSMLKFIFYNVKILFDERKHSHIYHLINPFSFSPILMLAVKIMNLLGIINVKTLFDIRTGPLREGIKLKINILLIKITCLLSDSTAVLFIPLGKYLLGNYGKINLLPLGFEPVKKSNYKKVNKLMNKKYFFKNRDIVMIYIGSTYYRRRIDKMLIAFDEAQKKNNNLKLIFVGKTEKYFQKYMKNKNIIYIGEVPYERVQQFIKMADIGLSWVPQVQYFQHQPPLKTLEYLGSGIPVLATDTLGHRFTVINNYNGVIYSEELYSEGMIKIANEYKQLRKNAFKSVKKYEWKCVVKKYLLIIYKKLGD
jgi:glycosyltransferase involved in cell wall biosynthesis